MTNVGIECPTCGELAPRGSNKCPACNSPLRLGGNKTQFFTGPIDLSDPRHSGDPAPERQATTPGPREDTPPQRPSGRFNLALREPDGDYEPGRVLHPRVVPGEEVVLIARVHHQTGVVDNFDLSVEGPQEWCSVRPETVYLTPRDVRRGDFEQEVEVRIAPPRTSEAVAGDHAVKVVAVSRANGARETVDLTLTIEPFAKLTVGLRPAELSTRYRARTRFVVRNEGNGPADLKIAGVDPTEKLRFKVVPGDLRVADEDGARVEVRAPKRTWLGQPKTLPFTVEASAASGEKVAANGRLDHLPYLRPWVLLAVPLIAAAVAWYVQQPEQGTVPPVENLSLRAAAQRVTAAGLRPRFESIEPADPQRPERRVIDQSPPGGKQLDIDKPVTIIFERGIGKEAAPGIVGMTVQEARAALEPRFQLGQVLPLEAPPNGTIKAQDPPEGQLLARNAPVSVTLDTTEKITANTVDRGGGAPTSTPSAEPTQPADEGLEAPLAYSDGRQIFVKEPGAGGKAIVGNADSENTRPTWDPAGKTIAYVHAVAEDRSQIRAVEPGRPRSDEELTDRDARYGAPAYSPDGTLLAMIKEDGSRHGGELCLMTADGGTPTCWEDDDHHYWRPAWGDETSLYALRREKDADQASGWTGIVRFTAEEPGGTAPDDWAADPDPVVSADVQSLAIGNESRIAALTRKSVDDQYVITLHDADGRETERQPRGLALCDLSWSGEDLVAVIDGCSENSPPPKIGKYDPDDLEADAEIVVRKGQDPALAPAD